MKLIESSRLGLLLTVLAVSPSLDGVSSAGQGGGAEQARRDGRPPTRPVDTTSAPPADPSPRLWGTGVGDPPRGALWGTGAAAGTSPAVVAQRPGGRRRRTQRPVSLYPYVLGDAWSVCGPGAVNSTSICLGTGAGQPGPADGGRAGAAATSAITSFSSPLGPDSRVQFDVRPVNAEVYVDGAYVGTTLELGPATPLQVAPGPHAIELRARGYAPLRVDVEVAPAAVHPFAALLHPARD